MFKIAIGLSTKEKVLLSVFFVLKCYWYFTEYSIQTDNALRMQYGIKWALGDFHPSHLVWAPLMSACYAIFYTLSDRFFLFGDLVLMLIAAIWEISIIMRIAKRFFQPRLQFWIIMSLIFYTGHVFTYQTNDIIVVWVFMEVIFALLNQRTRNVVFWTLLIPLIKYSAIAIVFLPVLYEIWRSKSIKFTKTKILYMLVAIVASLIYIGFTKYSGFASVASGLHWSQFKLLFRFDHFWMKYGVSEYLFRSLSHKLSQIIEFVIDVPLLTLLFSSFLFLSILFYSLKRKGAEATRSESGIIPIIVIISTLHILYMLVLLVLVPLESLHSEWTIGPNQNSIVLIEIGRYHNFLGFLYFIILLKLFTYISPAILKANTLYLIVIFLLSFKFSGNLFSFYNNIYLNNFKRFGVTVSSSETHIYGSRNYEAWKVHYILAQKNPSDRFK